MVIVAMLVLGLVFVLVLVWTNAALSASKMTKGASRPVAAVCVAGLSVLGLLTMFKPHRLTEAGPSGSDADSMINGLLLPYAALGLTLLILFLLMPVFKSVRRGLGSIEQGQQTDSRSDGTVNEGCRNPGSKEIRHGDPIDD